MNAKQNKQFREALGLLVGKPKLVDEGDGISSIELPFALWADRPLKIYGWKAKKSNKILLSAFAPLKGSNLKSLQELIRPLDVIITDQLNLIESSNRPLGKRVAALLQAVLSIDTLLRGTEVLNHVYTERSSIPAGGNDRQGGSQADGAGQPYRNPSGGIADGAKAGS